MSDTEPGWYPDGDGVVRWYDGQQWTRHVQPASLPLPVDDGPDADPGRPDGPGPWAFLALALVVVVVLGGLVGAAVLVGGDDDPDAGPAIGAATSGTTTPPTTSAPSPPPAPTEPAPTTPPPTTPAPPPGPPPGRIAARFTVAVIDVDCAGIRQVTTAEFHRRLGPCGGPEQRPADFSYSLDPAVIRGVKATVTGTLRRGGAPSGAPPDYAFSLTLVNTAGGWRVSDLAERP